MTSEIKVDTISEQTSANGVAIDSVTLKDGGVTATAASTITVADNSDNLTLTSTDADANSGPNLNLYRNSASPADSDHAGEIAFNAKNDAGEVIKYGKIRMQTDDVSDGAETGRFDISTMFAGSEISRFMIKNDEIVVNQNGVDFDFRVEGNNYANNLKVDAGSDVVLMGDGTDYASSQLQVTWADGRADSTAVAYFKNEKSSGTLFGITVQFRNLAPDNQTSILQSWQDTSAIRARCFADGDFQNHDNAYGSLSDERIKQDIRDSNSQWDDIKALKVRNFKKKDDIRQYGDNAWEQIGVIAQELEDAGMDKLVRHSDPTEADIASDPSFGTIDEDGNITVNEQVKGVNYSVLYMKAIKALQEAMAKIETLETKVKALEDA